MKLYLIHIIEAYMASERRVTAMCRIPSDTVLYKYAILEEAEVTLPDGFTTEQTKGEGSEIFKGNEAAEMVTEKVGGRYVTSLVTSDGVTLLHTWVYGQWGGRREGSGRPSTERKVHLAVRISSEAAEKIKGVRNKSEYIDRLIKNDNILTSVNVQTEQKRN